MTENQSNTVFVGGISWKANEENLKGYFSKYGTVLDCKIIVDRETNKSKGYGFVTFSNAETAEKVKKETHLSFLGKTMNVGDAYRRTDSKNSPTPNLYTYPAGYPVMQYSYPPVSYFYPGYGYEIPYMTPQFIPYYADPYAAGYYQQGAPYATNDDNSEEYPTEPEYLDGLTEQLADLHLQKNENDPTNQTAESKLVAQAE